MPGDPKMDRHMILRHLAEAERHVAEGNARISKQEAIIVQLEHDGRDTADSKALLKTMLECQALHEWHLQTVRAEL